MIPFYPRGLKRSFADGDRKAQAMTWKPQHGAEDRGQRRFLPQSRGGADLRHGLVGGRPRRNGAGFNLEGWVDPEKHSRLGCLDSGEPVLHGHGPARERGNPHMLPWADFPKSSTNLSDSACLCLRSCLPRPAFGTTCFPARWLRTRQRRIWPKRRRPTQPTRRPARGRRPR